jgi:hypothetical protein
LYTFLGYYINLTIMMSLFNDNTVLDMKFLL